MLPYQFIIAEDNILLASLTKRLILRRYADAVVHMYMNGQDALTAYDLTGADLLLIDDWMPWMNGPDMIRIIRMRGDHVPIIGMSSDSASAHMFFEAGTTAFFHGFDLIKSLVPCIEQLLLQERTISSSLRPVEQYISAAFATD